MVYSFIVDNIDNDLFSTNLLGTCVDKLNGFTCNCQAGFTGMKCDVDIDDCYTNPCRNGTHIKLHLQVSFRQENSITLVKIVPFI